MLLFRSALLLLLTAALGACVTYGGFDKSKVDQGPPASAPGLLQYTTVGRSLMNGHRAIRKVFGEQSGFTESRMVEPVPLPAQGVYVKATIENMAPSAGSGVSMYASYLTMFLIPAWSTSDGSHVSFDVYRDGTQVKRYEYEVQRKTFVWLPMVLFVWVNFFTTDESEAFEAITKQFLVDAAAQLHG